jgi:putative addiction module component (TIGR02574 family)
MTQRAQALLREALALPAEERATVAAELLASLDAPPADDAEAVRAAWATEIERRARRVLSGESTGEPWATVRERTARRLADQ